MVISCEEYSIRSLEFKSFIWIVEISILLMSPLLLYCTVSPVLTLRSFSCDWTIPTALKEDNKTSSVIMNFILYFIISPIGYIILAHL